MKAPRVTALSTLLLLALAVQASTPLQRTPVNDVAALMIEAIQSPSGAAHGVLDGEIAGAITRHFQASTPIHIDVRTLKRYRQPGCRRLSVSFWQEGVKLPDADAPRKQHVEFGIDYCLDGLPPRSLDEEAAP